MKPMKFIVALCIAALSVQYAAAQSYPAPAGIFRQEGIASWYGPDFDGKPTASGEIFNSSLFTAAHPTLPFGTILRVTNTNNDQQVTVKVNDRGPFVAGRIIDVSRAAAQQLDMIMSGTAPVRIEAINIASQPQQVQPEQPPQQSQQTYTPPVQPPQYSQPYSAYPPQQPQPTYVQPPTVIQQQPPVYAQPPQQSQQTYTPPVQPPQYSQPSYTQPPAYPPQQPQPTYAQPPTVVQQQPPVYAQPPQQSQPTYTYTQPPAYPPVKQAPPQSAIPEPPVKHKPPRPITSETVIIPYGPTVTVTIHQPPMPSTPAPSTPTADVAPPPPEEPAVSSPEDVPPTPIAEPVTPPPLPPPAPVTPPPPAPIAEPTPPPLPPPLPVAPPVPVIPPSIYAQPPAAVSAARLTPAAVIPVPGKTYTLQVGAFELHRNAVNTYVNLRKAGLNPSYDDMNPDDRYYRVLLKGIPGEEVRATAEKLAQAGFSEAIIKPEE